MADYYPLIARAVTGLDKNTGEARRALYERARTALVAQLRSVDPALSEADVTHERLALEDAIRRVEGEAARRPRQEEAEPAAYTPPPPPPPPEVSAETPPPDWEELQRELDGLEPPSSLEGDKAHEQKMDTAEQWQAPAFSERDRGEPPHASDLEAHPEAEPQHDTSSSAEPQRKRFAAGRPSSLVDEGLKGFRNVMAETDDLGGASASASKSARETREAFSSLPPASDMERLEPRFPGGDPRQSAQADFSPPPPRSEPRVSGRPLTPPRSAQDDLEEDDEQYVRSGSGILRKVIAIVAVLILLGGGVFAYRQWGGSITGMFAKAPATQTAKDVPQARPKISDRIGGAQQPQSSRPASAGAAVAQRAVLYEQGNGPQERKQYVGSVIWRNETASPGPGQPPDVAIKADVEIPERHLRMTVTIRRNVDKSQAASYSHTVEVLFNTQADFTPGGIADINGPVMEDAEPGRGLPLTGLKVNVANGFFLVGLSPEEAVMKRNIQLLKERAWMHVRMTYNYGQRALLAIEKGVPGDRAIEQALTAWGQMPPPSPPAPTLTLTPPAQPR